MKKLLALAVLVALTLPVLAWSASPYVSSIKPGTYELTINSLTKEINGLKGTGVVKNLGDRVEMTVTYGKDSKEVWTFDDKLLNQREWDPKANKFASEYNATASNPAKSNDQTFKIKCLDPAKNIGEGGANCSFSWEIKTSPTEIKYIVYGSKDSTPPTQRHEFIFKAK